MVYGVYVYIFIHTPYAYVYILLPILGILNFLTGLFWNESVFYFTSGVVYKYRFINTFQNFYHFGLRMHSENFFFFCSNTYFEYHIRIVLFF